jgi:pilus assembly protein Flp/PilA
MRMLQNLLDRNSLLTRLLSDDAGATAIEYGLIAALIAVAAIAAFQLVGTNLTSTFNNVASQL